MEPEVSATEAEGWPAEEVGSCCCRAALAAEGKR